MNKIKVLLAIVLTVLTLGCTSPKLPHLGQHILTGEDVLEVNNPIVRLYDSKDNFVCSGFVIDENYLVTAAHCVDAKLKTVNKALPIKFVGAYHRDDLALFQGDFRSFHKIPIIDSVPVGNDLRGHVVATCGFPLGQSTLVCTKALILGPSGSMFIARGELYPGMSGGPVIIPELGIAVGLNTATTTDSGNYDLVILAPLMGLSGIFNIEREPNL